MLHRINAPTGYALLAQIVQFQREVLVYACDVTTPASPGEASIKAVFNNKGEWLWDRLKPTAKGKQTDLCRGLDELSNYCKANPTEAQRILDAFDHDTKFHEHLNDPTFQFDYQVKLSAQAQAAVRGLMVAFYSELLFAGYPECVHGSKEVFNRDRFIGSFYSSNSGLRVCSACDGQKPDTKIDRREREKTFADADHFLPKSVYPFLSMHPDNLVPICVQCNRTFKLAQDPIDDHAAQPLLNSFHPYMRPAVDDIHVLVSRNANGEKEVAIEEKSGDKSRRIDSLNRIFSLETRWPDRLKDVQESLTTALSEWRYLRQPDAPTLRDLLEFRARRFEKQDERGRIQWQVLHASYLRFVLGDTDEFDRMLAQFTGN